MGSPLPYILGSLIHLEARLMLSSLSSLLISNLLWDAVMGGWARSLCGRSSGASPMSAATQKPQSIEIMILTDL